MEYGIRRTLETDLQSARELVETALKEQGFGVLTEIDVRATLKNKIDVDFDRYLILGACNPVFAHQALSAEREIGLLLPCNVILYQEESAAGDTGRTIVSAFDPAVGMSMIGNARLDAIGAQVKSKLEAALEAAVDALKGAHRDAARGAADAAKGSSAQPSPAGSR